MPNSALTAWRLVLLDDHLSCAAVAHADYVHAALQLVVLLAIKRVDVLHLVGAILGGYAINTRRGLVAVLIDENIPQFGIK